MILLDAVYIHQGGGKILLKYFINEFEKTSVPFFVLFDKRINIELIVDSNFRNFVAIDASENNRKQYYLSNSHKFTKIFCFANVPPPICISDKDVYIYFQNRLLLDVSNTNYTFLNRVLFYLKRMYLKFKNKPNYIWIVQTALIKDLLEQKLKIANTRIHILPFFDNNFPPKINQQLIVNRNKFLYIADCATQKNHINLLQAWNLLSKEEKNIFELHLTIPPHCLSLINKIDYLNVNGCRIINHGICDKNEIIELYRTCNYLIYPSLTESFGLPLIEAVLAGCEIMASDLPYVYEVVKPFKIFDPFDIWNILECIKFSNKNFNERNTRIIISNKIGELINLISKNYV